MGSHFHTILFGQSNGFSHHSRISSVKSAADVRRGEMGDYLLIQSQFVDAETLSHIGI
jgi:hypothetical protein